MVRAASLSLARSAETSEGEASMALRPQASSTMRTFSQLASHHLAFAVRHWAASGLSTEDLITDAAAPEPWKEGLYS
eukprot:CAMPEP_0172005042 /NCGR_PEP_ID=MMETSP1041-20130122/4817_1 /TAXON_ID=464988 /ORGANISM="Hemiselmis andersenii, Strain CCMP439" /LENGTH=76 /DNA_ID=CAMNT_0012658973 /DNA_START=100 /DNA_END=330 /DNA_ORIENTATION=-